MQKFKAKWVLRFTAVIGLVAICLIAIILDHLTWTEVAVITSAVSGLSAIACWKHENERKNQKETEEKNEKKS